MRSHSPTERTLLSGDNNVHIRVEVLNDAAVWIDLSDLEGVNFVRGASWQQDIDTPISGATISLMREADGVSLSPLMEGSPANTDGDEYSPLLNGGRAIRFYTAVTAPGEVPVSGDWKLVFWGKIDKADWSGETLTLTLSDLGARLMGTFIETEVIYGEPENPADEGVAVESVIQSIITDNSVPGNPTLVTPVSPNWRVRAYRQEKMPVFEATRNVVLQFGWDLRYKFGAGDDSSLTLSDPGRDSTAPDLTLPPSEYFDVTELQLGDADIRNKVAISYLSKETGEVEDYVETDDDSIGIYGVRYMEIAESASSNIDTAEEVQRLADAVLSDLSTPYATHRIESGYLWPVELHDIIALPANFVHYDAAQSIAVVAVQHKLEIQDGGGYDATTEIYGRGKPAGAYREWLRREGKGKRGSDLDKSIPVLLNFRVIEQTATTRTYGWVRGSLTRQVWVGQKVFLTEQLDDLADPWPVVASIAANTPPLADDEDTLTVLMPIDGETLLIQVEPRGADLFAGEVRRVEITGTLAPFEYLAAASDTDGGNGRLEVTIDDPRSVISTVRFWRTVLSQRTGPIAATSHPDPLQWVYSFALHPKHATLVQIEFVRNDGEPNFWSDVFSFDRDDIPEIQRVSVSYATDQATVLVDGDTDSDSLWYREVVDDVPGAETELTYRGGGTDHRFGVFVVTASPDNKRFFQVYAKNADGDEGVYREVEIDQYDIPERQVQVLARMVALDEETWTVEVTATSPVDGSRTVELVALVGDSTILDGAALDTPVASPAQWTFSRGTTLGNPSWATFEGHQSGLTSDSDEIIIPEQGQDTVPLVLRVIPLVSTNPAYQNVRVLVSDPQAPAPAASGDYVSIGYSSQGVGTIEHTTSQDQTPGSTTNPAVMAYVDDTLTPGFFDVPGHTNYNYIDFTIERPVHGSDPGRVSFFATAEGRAADTDHMTILPVDRLQLQVDIEQVDQTDEDVEVEVTVTDPKPGAGNYITLTPTKSANVGDLTPSGSGALPNGGTRSFIIPLTAFRSGKGQVIFTATATDRVQGSNFIDIPEIAPDPAGNLMLSIDEAGGFDAVVQGDSEIKSWKWLASDSAMPDDATVISTGTLVNARDLAIEDALTLEYEETGYFKAVPYYFTSAVGDPGIPVSGYATRPPNDNSVPAPGVALGDPDEGGDVRVDISGHSDVQSIKWDYSTSDYPTLSTVRSMTAVNAQNVSTLIDSNLDFGEFLYVTALAYTETGGGGDESPPGRHRVSRQNASVSKVLRLPAASFKPDAFFPSKEGGGGEYLEGAHAAGGGDFVGGAYEYFNLGPGCVITGFEMLSLVVDGDSSDAQAKLIRLDGAGGKAIISSLANLGSAGAYALSTDSALDEETGDHPYLINVATFWDGTGTTSRIAEIAIYYDAPALVNTQ